MGPFAERENAGQEAGLEEETKSGFRHGDFLITVESLGGWTCLLEFWKKVSAGNLRAFIIYMAFQQKSPGENVQTQKSVPGPSPGHTDVLEDRQRRRSPHRLKGCGQGVCITPGTGGTEPITYTLLKTHV